MNLACLLSAAPRTCFLSQGYIHLRSNAELEKEIVLDPFESRIGDRSPNTRRTRQAIQRAPKQRSRPSIRLGARCNALPRDTVVQWNVVVVCYNAGLGTPA